MSRAWQYTCPEGHTYGSIAIREKDPKYYCENCDERYSNLIDGETGKHYRP